MIQRLVNVVSGTNDDWNLTTKLSWAILSSDAGQKWGITFCSRERRNGSLCVADRRLGPSSVASRLLVLCAIEQVRTSGLLRMISSWHACVCVCVDWSGRTPWLITGRIALVSMYHYVITRCVRYWSITEMNKLLTWLPDGNWVLAGKTEVNLVIYN